VSIYSEMLKLVLDGESDRRDRSVAALISDALICRGQLTFGRGGAPAGRPGQAAERVADCLAYDAALVRLCRRLELDEDLTGDGETGAARRQTEARLAERLPTLAAALGGPEQGVVIDRP
jgi:hypothetical protein